MSEPEPTSEVEAAKMANGSGSLPEGMGLGAVTEKDSEEKRMRDEKDGCKRKDGEEKKDFEEKNEGEENGVKKVEVAEEGKEEKKTEDMNASEDEDVKMVDVEDSKMFDAEDVKMVDAEDVKDEKEVAEEEGGGKLNVEEKNDVKEEKDSEKVVDENKVKGLNKKKARGQVGDRGQEKDKRERGTKLKKLLKTPTPSSIDRPVRERKMVERLVEVIEKEPNKEFLVEKGRGTPLKDIPNVAYKLVRKKPADLKLLHQTLFGRKGKAANFKNHILQFSGFVWHESDEKQRAKMKEKLDKYVKDTLLDLCDLFDIPVSKATMRKEDLVAKLLDFMVAPHVTTDVILAEKDQQSTKSRKRKRVTKGSSSKSMGGAPTKQSRKKQSKSEDTSNSKGRSAQEKEDEDEDEGEEDNENVDSDEDQPGKESESEAKESEFKDTAEEDDDDDEDSKKSKPDKKRSSKQRGSVGKKMSKAVSSSRKSSLPTAKSLTRTSSSKHNKAEENNDVDAKVFFRKKKNVDVAKKKSAPKSGKKVAKGKVKSEKAEYPGQEELRKTICEILKEVDFNTATFTDILKQLATHYKIDMTPRKSAIKELIQEELTKLADEIEDDEDEDAEKEENPEPRGKEVEA